MRDDGGYAEFRSTVFVGLISVHLFGIITFKNLGIYDREETRRKPSRQRQVEDADAPRSGAGIVGAVLCTQSDALGAVSMGLSPAIEGGELSTFSSNGVIEAVAFRRSEETKNVQGGDCRHHRFVCGNGWFAYVGESAHDDGNCSIEQ